jgi:hypothetical protein
MWTIPTCVPMAYQVKIAVGSGMLALAERSAKSGTDDEAGGRRYG